MEANIKSMVVTRWERGWVIYIYLIYIKCLVQWGLNILIGRWYIEVAALSNINANVLASLPQDCYQLVFASIAST